MKIYQSESGANPPRVRAFLFKKGLSSDVEFVNIDVENGFNMQPAFRSGKNSKGTLPV